MDLTKPISLLDHGHLRYVEHWGSDERIVESARMSTQRSFVSWEPYKRCSFCDAIWLQDGPTPPVMCPVDERYSVAVANGEPPPVLDHKWKDFPRGDLGILSYLWKNKHSTPFEMAGLTLEVQAPIIVFREWHRHRVPFGYSEASARYAPLPALDYLPTVDRCLEGGGHLTKQAGAADDAAVLTRSAAAAWLAELEAQRCRMELHYQVGLQIGIPKELARLAMTVGRYSKMYATGNIRGWLSFLALRNAPDAQKEIRVYAEAIAQMLVVLYPRITQVVNESTK